MATIIPGAPRAASRHFGRFRLNVGGDQQVFVRRTCGNPTFWLHENSPAVKKQRTLFAEASHHYSTLTPPQKWLTKRRLADVPFVDNHGKSSFKLLQGRQLVISEDIRQLNVTGQFTKQPFQACIILCNPDYEPLAGTLYLEYNDGGVWYPVEGRELNYGNWLFVEVPSGMLGYRAWGEAIGYQDPYAPENQNMSEAELKAKHWHIMEVPPVIEELRCRYYSDPYPRMVTCDGQTSRTGPAWKKTWADIHDGAGTVGYNPAAVAYASVHHASLANTYFAIHRAIMNFDTSRIGLYDTIKSAILRIWIEAKTQGVDPQDYAFGVVKSNSASDEAVVPADYNTFPSGSLLTEAIPLPNIPLHAWTTFTFTPYGLSQISKEGVTKLGIREINFDLQDHEPDWHKSSAYRIDFDAAGGSVTHCACLLIEFDGQIPA